MRVTVKDIAAELGISQGTVSKALMGKKGISEKTRNNVLETAARLGYKVNRVAQTLSRQTIYIGVVASKAWIQYYGEITRGIEQETARLSDYNVVSVFHWVSSPLAVTEIENAVQTLKSQRVNAVLFCLATAARYIDLLKGLVESGILTMVVGTAIRGMPQFPVVRLDSKTAGHMAAEFMNYLVPHNRPTAIFIGNKDIFDHSDKVEGYMDEMNAAGRSVLGVYETQDDTELAFLLTKKMISDFPELGGIYVATGNSISVCRCLEEIGAKGKIKIIGTDIFHDSVSKIKQGTIQGIIYQNPTLQGEIAVRTVYKGLSERNSIPSEIIVAPQLVLKSNVERIQLGIQHYAV